MVAFVPRDVIWIACSLVPLQKQGDLRSGKVWQETIDRCDKDRKRIWTFTFYMAEQAPASRVNRVFASSG